MMKEGFKPLTVFKQKHLYGGFNWLPFVVAALPFVLESLTHTISSVKILGSDKGSIKYRGYESHWDKKAAPKSILGKINNTIDNHIYAY